jgi:hypothetical protein
VDAKHRIKQQWTSVSFGGKGCGLFTDMIDWETGAKLVSPAVLYCEVLNSNNVLIIVKLCGAIDQRKAYISSVLNSSLGRHH